MENNRTTILLLRSALEELVNAASSYYPFSGQMVMKNGKMEEIGDPRAKLITKCKYILENTK